MPVEPPVRHPSAPPLLEICIETVTEAIEAVKAGADRLEVCGSMIEAGITPSIGLIEAIVARVRVPAFVMVRPRGGDFVFDDAELDVMLRDIESARRAGAGGIVSGALERTGIVDRDATRRLVEAAAPLPFTFHRAFDLTPEVELAFDVLRSIGVRRVLTSGGASSASVGGEMIGSLVRRAGSAMTIVAGGGVRSDNVVELVRRTAVIEVHARPTRDRTSGLTAARGVRFGAKPLPVERTELDPAQVRALAGALAEIRAG
jgi:copper homeostasis protein